jgi:hypothetical protein
MNDILSPNPFFSAFNLAISRAVADESSAKTSRAPKAAAWIANPPVVAERVQHPRPVAPRSDGPVILPLVKEKAGLLTSCDVHPEGQAVLLDPELP